MLLRSHGQNFWLRKFVSKWNCRPMLRFKPPKSLEAKGIISQICKAHLGESTYICSDIPLFSTPCVSICFIVLIRVLYNPGAASWMESTSPLSAMLGVWLVNPNLYFLFSSWLRLWTNHVYDEWSRTSLMTAWDMIATTSKYEKKLHVYVNSLP